LNGITNIRLTSENAFIRQYKNLRQNPYFQVRYEDIRCLPLKKYPYMIHFVVEEVRERVVVLGIICTHRDPAVGEERANR